MNIIKPEITLDNEEIEELAAKYHFNNVDTEDIQSVYQEMKAVVKPIIYYEIAGVDKKLSFVEYEKYMVVIASLGRSIDQLQETYMESEKILRAYIIECISLVMLQKLYQSLAIVINNKERLWVKTYDFLGDKYSINMTEDIFSLLRPEDIVYNDALMLNPKKSVVYIAELTDNRDNSNCNICSNCKNWNCPNRIRDKQNIINHELI